MFLTVFYTGMKSGLLHCYYLRGWHSEGSLLRPTEPTNLDSKQAGVFFKNPLL